MINIILFGAGGHCLSCLDVILNEKKYKIKNIIDKKNTSIQNFKISRIENLEKILKISKYAHISFGFIKSSKNRIKFYEKLKKYGFKFPVIKSPRSYVSNSSKIGEGTILMHDVLVNSESSIGKNCIINTKALIEHETIIEDHCHISTGVIVNGNCVIGRGSFIGSGAVIKQGVKVGKNCTIGSNLKINKNIKSNSTVI